MKKIIVTLVLATGFGAIAKMVVRSKLKQLETA